MQNLLTGGVVMKIKYLLFFLSLSILFFLLNLKTLCFFASLFSIMPMSSCISYYTEILSKRFGDKAGGMLNATAGNISEILICIFALKSNMFELIKAGLIGSIIGNILFVLGISIFLGGIKYQEQTFNKNIARTNLSLLFLALSGIIIVSIYDRINLYSSNISLLSFGVALILIFVYILGLIFSLVTHRNIFIVQGEESFHANNGESNIPLISTKKAFILLGIFTILVAVESRFLVNSIEYLSFRYNIPQNFIGIIIIPLASNASEYITAIIMALKNRIGLCIEIAVGSGMQIALFAAPLITIIGYIISKPIGFVYDFYHITSLIISLVLAFYVFQDGKTYWIEGAILIATYFIIGLGYALM